MIDVRRILLLSASAAVTICAGGAIGQTACTRPPAIEAKLHSHADAAVYAESGAWFDARHRYDCAALDYRSAVKLNPQSAHFALLLGESLLNAGDLAGAETALRQSIGISPGTVEAHEKLADVLEQLRRNDEAESEWMAALKLSPQSIPALEGMAKHLTSEGNYSAAIQLLRSAPSSESLTLELAQTYAAAGALTDAENSLRKAVAENPSSFPLTRALIGVLVDEHADQRTFEEPVQLATQFATAHPDNVEAQQLLLQLLIAWVPQGGQAGDLARATPLARRLLASHPQDPYFLYVNGMIDQQAGDYADAKGYLEKSLTLDPSNEKAHYALGMVLAALNDPSGARQEFEQSLALGNNRPEVRFQLAKTLRLMGNTQGADKQLKIYSDEMAAASNLRIAKLKEGQADNELAAGHVAQAVDLYRQALSASSDNAMLNFKFAMACDKAGNTASERAALEKAVQLNPDLAVAQNQLGYLASRSGDSAAAEEHFRQAVRAVPAYAEAWINLAATLGMESKLPEAQQAIAHALKADPNNSQALQLQQELSAAQH